MAERGVGFGVVKQLVRIIPDALPGKTRIARFVLRSFIDERSVRLPDRFGNVLSLPSLQEPIAIQLFAFGVYEPDTIAAVLTRLGRSGVYVNVGANVGALALPVAAQRPAARIVCIEADPEIADVLRRNVTENKRSNVGVRGRARSSSRRSVLVLRVNRPATRKRICYRSGIGYSATFVVACLAQLSRLL